MKSKYTDFKQKQRIIAVIITLLHILFFIPSLLFFSTMYFSLVLSLFFLEFSWLTFLTSPVQSNNFKSISSQGRNSWLIFFILKLVDTCTQLKNTIFLPISLGRWFLLICWFVDLLIVGLFACLLVCLSACLLRFISSEEKRRANELCVVPIQNVVSLSILLISRIR